MANYNAPAVAVFTRLSKLPHATNVSGVTPGKTVTTRRYKFPVGGGSTAPTTGQIWPRGRA